MRDMKKKRWQGRHLAEAVAKVFLYLSCVLVIGCLGFILAVILIKGLPALSWEMITQAPQGGYYLGKEGGILNAILGSLYLAGGATLLAMLVSLPIALYLHTYLGKSRWGDYVRLALDVLWGIPSIVYGAFGFTLMLAVGLSTSLLSGILVLTLLEMPIMVRAMDEVIRLMPGDLEQAGLAIGSTKLEVALHIVLRQMLPGIVSAVLLAFGRGIGDAASVLFTAGYTDRIPSSLFSPGGFFAPGDLFPIELALCRRQRTSVCLGPGFDPHRFGRQPWVLAGFRQN